MYLIYFIHNIFYIFAIIWLFLQPPEVQRPSLPEKLQVWFDIYVSIYIILIYINIYIILIYVNIYHLDLHQYIPRWPTNGDISLLTCNHTFLHNLYNIISYIHSKVYGIFHIIIQDIIQQVWLEIKAAVDDMFRIGVNPVDVRTFVFFVSLRIYPNVFVDGQCWQCCQSCWCERLFLCQPVIIGILLSFWSTEL